MAGALALGLNDDYPKFNPRVKFTKDSNVALENGVIVMDKNNFNDVVASYAPLLMHLYYGDK